jgi:16S rRNA processing protein RimM
MTQPTAEWYTLASIVRPQGRRGEVIADLLTDFPDQFTGAAELCLLRVDEVRSHVRVESHWMPTGRNAGRIVLKLEGVDSISDAELLTGCKVQLRQSERVDLDQHTYYVTDLVGCTLLEGGVEIGMVVDLHFPLNSEGRRLQDAASLFVVRRANGDEIMVPFVNDFVEEIDTEAKTIRMKLPTGLLELNANG